MRVIGCNALEYLKYLITDNSVSNVGIALPISAEPSEEEAIFKPRCRLPEQSLLEFHSAEMPFTQ